MKKSITKRTVDALKPGEILWDEKLSGFGCRCLPSGQKRYLIKYRKGARQRWHTIGAHGKWTPDQARSEAKKLFGAIENGADPSKDKQDAARAGTVSDLGDRFLERHSKVHKKASSSAEDARIFAKYIRPGLGTLKARDVTRADVADFMEGMRKTPYMANRALALLSCMFGKADKLRIDAPVKNPCEGVKRYKEKARERYLSPVEIKRLGRALRVVDKAGDAEYFAAFVRLLLLTGARLSEILTAKWEYFDASASVLRLPDSKTGSKTIYLSAEAVAVILSLKKQANNPYLICGSKEGHHLVNVKKPWARLRKAALISDVRIHDLRHSYASAAVTNGLTLPVIGKLLGHKKTQTTARYAHLADDPARAAAALTGGKISESLGNSTVH